MCNRPGVLSPLCRRAVIQSSRLTLSPRARRACPDLRKLRSLPKLERDRWQVSSRFIDRRTTQFISTILDNFFDSLPIHHRIDQSKDACIYILYICFQGLTPTCLIPSLNIALRNHKIRNHKILLERAKEARRVGRVQGRESGKGAPNRNVKKKHVEQLSRVHECARARKCVHR